jgi:hypothetical protein
VPVVHGGGRAYERALREQPGEREGEVAPRFELALEATRRPAPRARYDALGRGYGDLAAGLLGAAGAAATAGAGQADPPDAGELRAQIGVLLEALLNAPVADRR